jgi:hypothetical protein
MYAIGKEGYISKAESHLKDYHEKRRDYVSRPEKETLREETLYGSP